MPQFDKFHLEQSESLGRLHHEGVASSPRFALIFLGSFVLGLVAALVVNFLGNSAQVFPSPVRESESDRGWKARIVERFVAENRPPEAIVFGSSRAWQIKASTVEQLTGLRTFNWAVTSGTVLDSRIQLAYVTRLGAPPKLILLEIEDAAWAWDGELQPSILSHVGVFRETPFPDNVRVFGDACSSGTIPATVRSLLALTRPVGASQTWRYFNGQLWLDDGYIVMVDAERAKIRGQFFFEKVIQENITELRSLWSKPYRVHPRWIRYLEEFLDIAKANGIRIVAFVPPMHQAWEKACFDSEDRRVARRELIDRLAGILAAHGTKLHDYSRVESFGGDPNEFWDGTHQTPVNMDRMTRAMLGADAASPATAPDDLDLIKRYVPENINRE